MSEFTSILLEPTRILDFFKERRLPEPGYRIYTDRTVFSLEEGSYPVSVKDLLSKLHREFSPSLLRSGNVPWVEYLVKQLVQRKEMVSTAESCTGGGIGALLTEIPGSSRIYWGGYITYSNDAKVRLLGVPEQVLLERGAVSRETVSFFRENPVGHSCIGNCRTHGRNSGKTGRYCVHSSCGARRVHAGGENFFQGNKARDSEKSGLSFLTSLRKRCMQGVRY